MYNLAAIESNFPAQRKGAASLSSLFQIIQGCCEQKSWRGFSRRTTNSFHNYRHTASSPQKLMAILVATLGSIREVLRLKSKGILQFGCGVLKTET